MLEFENENINNYIFIFSLLTRKPIKIINGSLNNFIGLLKKISPETEIYEKENYLEFIPGTILGGKIEHECENNIADYIIHLLILLSFARKDSTIKIQGITNGINGIVNSVDVIKNVYLKIIKDFGMNAELKIIKRGFYPEGKGEVELKVNCINQIKAIEKDETRIFKIRGCAISSRLNSIFTTKIVEIIQKELKDICKNLRVAKDILGGTTTGPSPGYQIVLFAEGNSTIYYSEATSENNKKIEDITHDGIKNLLQTIDVGCAFDFKSTDFILSLMAISENKLSKIKMKIGKNNKNFIKEIQKFFSFQISKNEGFVSSYGSGMKNINKLNL